MMVETALMWAASTTQTANAARRGKKGFILTLVTS
jgi:hypothetical protein